MYGQLRLEDRPVRSVRRLRGRVRPIMSRRLYGFSVSLRPSFPLLDHRFPELRFSTYA